MDPKETKDELDIKKLLFKTLDDDVIPNWDDEVDEFDDADDEQGNLL